MRLIGFNLRKLSAERKKDIKGKLEIKSNLTINKIEKEEIDIAGEVLRFDFLYEIKYEPGFADIIFEGGVLVIPEDSKKILKEWKKKKIAEEIRIPIFNFIMSKCNIKALQLEEEFNLPLHLPMPRLSKQQQNGQTGQANYAG